MFLLCLCLRTEHKVSTSAGLFLIRKDNLLFSLLIATCDDKWVLHVNSEITKNPPHLKKRKKKSLTNKKQKTEKW